MIIARNIGKFLFTSLHKRLERQQRHLEAERRRKEETRRKGLKSSVFWFIGDKPLEFKD